MDAARTCLSDGAVAIRDGRFVAVGPRTAVLDAYQAPRLLDRPGQILLPGFSDCHTHSTQVLIRGLVAGELPMIYRLMIPADMHLSEHQAYLATKLCATQLALSGVTTMCDFASGTTPGHEDAIIQGALDAGLRCLFLRGNGDQRSHHASLYAQISDRSSRARRAGDAERDLLRTEGLLRHAAATPTGLFHAGVCPSGLLGFSDEYFTQAASLARAYDVTLQVHAARDREEVEFCLATLGRRPIEHLHHLGVVDERLVVVHGILATDGEIRTLGQARANVAHSAVECVNILNAIPAVHRMRGAGITVGLGCDNAVNDIFAVMQAARVLQVGVHGLGNYEPDCLTELDILAMATCDAARLLRLDRQIGSIETGKAADLAILDGDSPHLQPIQHLPTDIVRYAGRGDVRDVMVAGRFVVEDPRHTRVDVEALAAELVPVAREIGDLLTARRYTLLRGCSCC